MSRKEGLWLAIDGIDAVGKSTQVPRVASQLRESGIDPVAELTEFSSSPVGRTILDILEKNRFYALNEQKTSPLADTVHLLSDIVYSYETTIAPVVESQGVAVSDRGASSFVAYQGVRIGERSKNFNLKQAVSWAETLAKHCLVIPDLTVLIRISHDELMRRVISRGESPLSADELEFLDKVDQTMLRTIRNTSKDHIVIDGQQPLEEITQQIVSYLMSKKK